MNKLTEILNNVSSLNLRAHTEGDLLVKEQLESQIEALIDKYFDLLDQNQLDLNVRLQYYHDLVDELDIFG